MDNFEWANGYEITFGLYSVDRQTMKRTSKLSARWFTDFLTSSTSHNTKEKLGQEVEKAEML
jgi:beta-glucosidase